MRGFNVNEPPHKERDAGAVCFWVFARARASV